MTHHYHNHSGQPDLNATQAMPSQPMDVVAEGWPTMPDPVSQSSSGAIPYGPITGPLPPPTRRGYGSNRSAREDWREIRAQRDQTRNMQQRREYFWRRQFEVRQERQRLDVEEQALQQQWDTLPQSPSRLVRLIVVASILTLIIGGIVWDPALLIPLILVLLILGSIQRRRRPAFRSHDAHWAERERYRIQSRVAWIDARMASLAQEEQAISSELLALPTPQPDPEP